MAKSSTDCDSRLIICKGAKKQLVNCPAVSTQPINNTKELSFVALAVAITNYCFFLLAG